jgi:hypothetical protein
LNTLAWYDEIRPILTHVVQRVKRTLRRGEVVGVGAIPVVAASASSQKFAPPV